MTTGGSFLPSAEVVVVVLLLFSILPFTHGLGGSSTIAISHATQTVCGILAATSPRAIHCFSGNASFTVQPNVTFDSISGGRNFFCGLRSDGSTSSLFCWAPQGTTAPARRIFHGPLQLVGVSVGEDHVAAVDNTGVVRYWRVDLRRFQAGPIVGGYYSLTSGNGFSCAIERSVNRVRCWGDGGDEMQEEFAEQRMKNLVAGDAHICGLNLLGAVICKGRNESGQLGVGGSAYEYSTLALGRSHTCAIRRANGSVVCWGGRHNRAVGAEESFELIVAGGDMTCGLTSGNFSVVCWGLQGSLANLPGPQILPGFCTDDHECRCGVFPDSDWLCSGSGVICKPCDPWIAAEPPPQNETLSSEAKATCSRRSMVLTIVGLVGALAGISSVLFCLWNGICKQKKVHNSVQPTISGAVRDVAVGGNSRPNSPICSPSKSMRSKSWSSVFRRQGSRVMRRQRSGPSSSRHERAKEFTFNELAEATDHFSLDNKIGAGSFGTVYHGKLQCGREVAIKRCDNGPRMNRFQEKESAFQSELAFLSRLHHKHLVGLVGFCEEREERLLVYDFMKNGALYDHLHSMEPGDSNLLSSWKMRIKVLLDASRGIEYLHNYAVPPIIHRDIKSSNILLDENWTARVSDFGLSLNGPDTDGAHLSIRAAGTVGYMDPQYYGLHHLTVKSDVYGLGVVMLEVLTGKRAVFKEGEGEPMSVVDYAVRRIVEGEMRMVLDDRVPGPTAREAEAVERVANTAVHCVKMEGRERPTITDVVANLECALMLCDDSHGSISSASIASLE